MVGGASATSGLIRVILPLLVAAMAIQGRAGFAPSPGEDGGVSTTAGHPDPPTTITPLPIAAQVHNPIGTDHHEPPNQGVMSADFGPGEPRNFDLGAPHGTR